MSTENYYGAAEHSLKRFCWLKELCNGFPQQEKLWIELKTLPYYAMINNRLHIL